MQAQSTTSMLGLSYSHNTDWQDLAGRTSRGETSFVNLRGRRRANDGLTARVETAPGQSVIIKLWNRPGISGQLRRLTRTGPAMREWRALRHAASLGVRVASPLHVCSLRSGEAKHTEALFLEDLGATTNGVEHLKYLVRSGRTERATAFNRSLIETTATMVGGGLLDSDHRLTNFAVAADGLAYRLDLEIAHRVRCLALHHRLYGEMLGGLIATYCFAVQPDSRQVREFAGALLAELRPPRPVMKTAARLVMTMLERQQREQGVIIAYVPHW